MPNTAFTRSFDGGTLTFLILRPSPSQVEVALTFSTTCATTDGHTLELFTPLSVYESPAFQQTITKVLENRARLHHAATAIRKVLLKQVIPWLTENAHIVSRLVLTHPFAHQELVVDELVFAARESVGRNQPHHGGRHCLSGC